MFIRASTLLRIASAIAAVQGLGHGALFLRARPTHGPDEVAVVSAMKDHAFKFAIAPRSYWDMYFGYGLASAATAFVEAALFWLLARIAANDPALVRPIAVLFVVANLAHIAMLVRYFAFPLPMVFDALIALALAGAAIAS